MSRFERASYLLLEYVVEFKVPVSILARPDCPEGLMNRPHHKLKAPDLIRAIGELLNGGDIFLSVDNVRMATVGEDLLENCFEDKSQTKRYCYGLTATGAARWESWSQPDWALYVDLVNGEPGNEPAKGSIVSLNRDRASEALHALPFLNQRVIPHSVHWETLASYAITYWKTVPQAYKAAFTYVDEDGEPFRSGLMNRPDKQRRIVDLFSPCGWFTRPF